jgi:hypothetical protein
MCKNEGRQHDQYIPMSAFGVSDIDDRPDGLCLEERLRRAQAKIGKLQGSLCYSTRYSLTTSSRCPVSTRIRHPIFHIGSSSEYPPSQYPAIPRAVWQRSVEPSADSVLIPSGVPVASRSPFRRAEGEDPHATRIGVFHFRGHLHHHSRGDIVPVPVDGEVTFAGKNVVNPSNPLADHEGIVTSVGLDIIEIELLVGEWSDRVADKPSSLESRCCGKGMDVLHTARTRCGQN